MRLVWLGFVMRTSLGYAEVTRILFDRFRWTVKGRMAQNCAAINLEWLQLIITVDSHHLKMIEWFARAV